VKAVGTALRVAVTPAGPTEAGRMSDALLEAEALLEQLPDAVSRRTLGERLTKAITGVLELPGTKSSE